MLEHVLEHCAKFAQVSELQAEILSNWDDLSVRYPLIRQAYYMIDGEEYNPYYLDMPMTPIESQLWQDIRNFPFQVRMYREYPVGKYFVDFGDPWAKLAIEADGAEFHDPVKDMHRDRYLESLGWEVKRVKGKDCIKKGIINGVLDDYYRPRY
jgi:very-short-patch-repair endonuclease